MSSLSIGGIKLGAYSKPSGSFPATGFQSLWEPSFPTIGPSTSPLLITLAAPVPLPKKSNHNHFHINSRLPCRIHQEAGGSSVQPGELRAKPPPPEERMGFNSKNSGPKRGPLLELHNEAPN